MKRRVTLSILLSIQANFSHASPWPQLHDLCAANSYETTTSNASIWPYRQFKSSSATPPEFAINQTGQELAPGLLFLDVENSGTVVGEKQQRPVIVTSQGDLIWAGPIAPTSNFRKQILHGKPVISFWYGDGSAGAAGLQGHGYGKVAVLDAAYNQIYTVCPKLDITYPPSINSSSCAADVHESFITPSNTILITVYNTTQADLSSVGGPKDGWVFDSLAVEIDLETNEPLFVWSPLAHVALNASRLPIAGTGKSLANPYDFFHINSIQPYKDGFLINSRHTWESYFVDRSGNIVWTINGATGGDFGPLPDDGKFSWQHQTRLHDLGNGSALLTLFADNNNLPIAAETSYEPSYGVALTIDLPPNKNKSTVVYQSLIDAKDLVYSYAEGSNQLLANGNSLIGYGIYSIIKEFGPDRGNGSVYWSARFGYVNNRNGGQSYRAAKAVWHATPHTAIDLVVETLNEQDTLGDCAGGSLLRGYVSWNGSTETSAYTLFAGDDKEHLAKVGSFSRKGFETAFVIPTSSRFVRVAAQEAHGRYTGASAIVPIAA